MSQSPSGSGKVGAESQLDPTNAYMLSIILQKLHNSPLQLNNNICARHCNREIARKKEQKVIPSGSLIFLTKINIKEDN